MNPLTTLNEPIMPVNITQPWRQYKRPFVRDLAFALASSNAINHWPLAPTPATSQALPILVHNSDFWQQQYARYSKRLDELDNTRAYQDLTRYLMSRPSPYRLGFHFEGLLHFWLEDGYRLNTHPYEVLSHNLQLFDDKQTIGELDFVLRNHNTDEVEHWELAVKFYIGSPPFKLANWVGINARDNLERKLNHMQDKPFSSTQIDLDFYAPIAIDRRYAVIKGRFFYPASYEVFERPTWMTRDFMLHHWYAISDTSVTHNSDMKNRDSSKAGNEHHLDLENISAGLSASVDLACFRPTHYIEWFTHRPFYNQLNTLKRLQGRNASNNLTPLPAIWPYSSLKLEEIQTGLYMNDDEHVVFINQTQVDAPKFHLN